MVNKETPKCIKTRSGLELWIGLVKLPKQSSTSKVSWNN